MPVSGVGPTGGVNTAGVPQMQDSMGLGQDAFMMLLLAQFKNQDPLRPMEDTEFIAQLAQFNSLNELIGMNKTLATSQVAQVEMYREIASLKQTIQSSQASEAMLRGSSLIGKEVTGTTEDGTEIGGVVTGLRLVDGQVILDIGSETLPLLRVESVKEPSTEMEPDPLPEAPTARPRGTLAPNVIGPDRLSLKS